MMHMWTVHELGIAPVDAKRSESDDRRPRAYGGKSPGARWRPARALLQTDREAAS
jgi:hypothetical protein